MVRVPAADAWAARAQPLDTGSAQPSAPTRTRRPTCVAPPLAPQAGTARAERSLLRSCIHQLIRRGGSSDRECANSEVARDGARRVDAGGVHARRSRSERLGAQAEAPLPRPEVDAR